MSSTVKCDRGVNRWVFYLMDYRRLPVTLSAGEVILVAVCLSVYDEFVVLFVDEWHISSSCINTTRDR